MSVVSTPATTAVLAVRVSKSAAVSAIAALTLTLLTLSLMYTKSSKTSSVLTSLVETWVTSKALLMTLWRWKTCLALVANAVSGRAWTTGLAKSRRGTSSLGVSEWFQFLRRSRLLLLTVALRLALVARLRSCEWVRSEATTAEPRRLSGRSASVIAESATQARLTRLHGRLLAESTGRGRGSIVIRRWRIHAVALRLTIHSAFLTTVLSTTVSTTVAKLVLIGRLVWALIIWVTVGEGTVVLLLSLVMMLLLLLLLLLVHLLRRTSRVLLASHQRLRGVLTRALIVGIARLRLLALLSLLSARVRYIWRFSGSGANVAAGSLLRYTRVLLCLVLLAVGCSIVVLVCVPLLVGGVVLRVVRWG